MICYRPFKEILRSEDLGTYVTYGIRIVDSNRGEIGRVSDVSVNETFVADLCRRLTRYRLSPIHLADVLDDEL